MLELDESTGMSKDEVYGYFKNAKGLATYVYSQLPNDFGTFNGALRESAMTMQSMYGGQQCT